MRGLSCQHCGAPIEDKAIDRRSATATCAHCGGVSALGYAEALGAGRPTVPLPEKFRVQGGEALEISWRWLSLGSLAQLAALAIIVGVFASGQLPIHLLGMSPLLLALFAACGASASYSTLARVLNRTSLRVDGRALRIRHFPLPWWPWRTIPTRDIDQIFSRRDVREVNDRQQVTYSLHAILGNGRSVALLRDLTDEEQAAYLEQEIELRLGIRDRAVGTEASFVPPPDDFRDLEPG
jgi:hypothetical protein